MVVVAMLTGALLKVSQGGLFRTSHYRDAIRAEQAAKGGANHMVALLEQNNDYNTPLTGTLGGATYTVTFDPDEPYFSVNNLGNDSSNSQSSFQGHAVAAHSADIIVVGTCGMSRQVIRVVVQQGFSSLRSVAAVGRVSLTGNVVVDGVKSLTPPNGQALPEPAPGGILSKHRTADSSQPAIAWVKNDRTDDFKLSELSRLETAPSESGTQSMSANLQATYPSQIIDNGAADTIPDINVAAKVNAGLSSRSSKALVPGGSTMSGYVFVADQRTVDGDLTVNGDIVLSDGTLYVNGDLTLNGGIEGAGSVYVTGNVEVNGGNTMVQASQPTGAALMAGGDITLQGLNAEKYLDELVAMNPSNIAFADAVQDLHNKLTTYQTSSSAGDFWGLCIDLAKHQGPPSGQPWVSPLPGPDGTHNFAWSNGIIPQTILRIKQDVPGYTTDPKAQKLVSALEEMQFHFRNNLHNIRTVDGKMQTLSGDGLHLDDDYTLHYDTGGAVLAAVIDRPPNAILGMAWDDDTLPQVSHTHDHLGFSGNDVLHQARRDAFFLNNPLDLSWLGDSTFQGLVYARGNVMADTRFKVIGSLISLGDVQLNNGSTLTFNEEYRSLLGQHLPIGIVHFEEL